MINIISKNVTNAIMSELYWNKNHTSHFFGINVIFSFRLPPSFKILIYILTTVTIGCPKQAKLLKFLIKAQLNIKLTQ